MNRSPMPMLWIAAALVAGSGCANNGRTIKIPESALARPTKPGAAKRRAGNDPYVIKMSDGERTWQFEFPVSHSQSAFEAVIPLDLGEELERAPGGNTPEGPADRDVKRAAAKPAAGGAPAAAGGAAAPGMDADGPSPSYLTTLAKVNALFRKRQYEIAMIELARLEQAYPEDERVLEMKGTLYWRLRKPKLAREAWERVLAINPDNAAVAQALENLLAE